MQKLIILRCFFKKWNSLDYYGIDDKAIILLKSMRLKSKKPGTVVKREDPNKGALTDNEHKALNQAIDRAYKSRKLTLQEISAALLVSFTGRRSSQLIALKFKDIVEELNFNGDRRFFINIPRVKQGLSFRQTFRMLSIDHFLYEKVKQQANNSVSRIEAHIGRSLLLEELDEVPIFLDDQKFKILNDGRDFFDFLVSDRLHSSINIFNVSLRKIIEIENVISERTGKRIKVNAYRLRYTIGTKLAYAGHSVQVIAELLDHSSISSAGAYIENLPDNSEKINQAMSPKLTFIADVFLGGIKVNEVISNNNSLVRKVCSSCVEHSAMPCHECIYFKRFNEGDVHE